MPREKKTAARETAARDTAARDTAVRETAAREIRESYPGTFRMSMQIGKTELVALAREIHEGSDFNGSLSRCKESFRKKLETALWAQLKEKYPDRDFTCGKPEPLTHANIVTNLKPVLKCKFFFCDSPRV